MHKTRLQRLLQLIRHTEHTKVCWYQPQPCGKLLWSNNNAHTSKEKLNRFSESTVTFMYSVEATVTLQGAKKEEPVTLTVPPSVEGTETAFKTGSGKNLT